MARRRVGPPGQRSELGAGRGVAPEGDEVQLDGARSARADDEQQVGQVPGRAASSPGGSLLGDECPQDAAHLGDRQPRPGELQEEHAPRLLRGGGSHLAKPLQVA
ncbi:MAG: hypothetical protein F4236_03570 [Acidimicrobiia bacterium]|nr:hypothetical protein [Acidimicrobiia bacterium]